MSRRDNVIAQENSSESNEEIEFTPAGVDVVHIGIQDDLEHHPGMVRAAPAFLIQHLLLPENRKAPSP